MFCPSKSAKWMNIANIKILVLLTYVAVSNIYIYNTLVLLTN